MDRSWESINEQLKRCRQLNDKAEIVKCLEEIWQNYPTDGMAAFALAEGDANIGRYEEALKLFEKAEMFFPLDQYKKKAREAIKNINKKINEKLRSEARTSEKVKMETERLNASNTLFIVSCTKTKIWNIDPTAPPFVPARYAYRGERFVNFLRWVEDFKIEAKDYKWVILSAKYGFIEPWHPICEYDVSFDIQDSYPISIESLSSQVNQKRKWQYNSKAMIVKLTDFSMIICVNFSPTYLKNVFNCFPGAMIKNIKSYELIRLNID